MSQTLPNYTILSYAVPNLNIFEQSEKIEVITFLLCTEFLLLGMKVYWDEVIRGIQLGDNTGDECSHAVADHVSLCWGLNFNWLVLYIHTHLSTCILSFNWCKILLSPDLPECNYCVSCWVSVHAAHHHVEDRTGQPIQFVSFTLRQGGRVSDMFIVIILFCTFRHWIMGRVQNVSNSECSVPLSHQVRRITLWLGRVQYKILN